MMSEQHSGEAGSSDNDCRRDGGVLARSLIAENTLKFAAGGLLCGFGTFWTGEGIGIAWPADDWSVLALIVGFLVAAAFAVPICRARHIVPSPAKWGSDLRAVVAMLREFGGLFVDDGSLAATLLVWIVLCGLLLRLPPESAWQGPILFVGPALILMENTLRSAKARSR